MTDSDDPLYAERLRIRQRIIADRALKQGENPRIVDVSDLQLSVFSVLFNL